MKSRAEAWLHEYQTEHHYYLCWFFMGYGWASDFKDFLKVLYPSAHVVIDDGYPLSHIMEVAKIPWTHETLKGQRLQLIKDFDQYLQERGL
jgi:hypothetical protein